MKTVEQLKLALKSGEYNGVDIMEAWCTMENQQKHITELTHALNELYEASIALYDHLSEVQCNKGLEKGLFKSYVIAVSKADKLLEGN